MEKQATVLPDSCKDNDTIHITVMKATTIPICCCCTLQVHCPTFGSQIHGVFWLLFPGTAAYQITLNVGGLP